MQLRDEIIEAVVHGRIQRPHWHPHGKPYFPTIGTCLVCDGVKSCSEVLQDDGTRLQPTPEEAFMLALVEHGTYLAQWQGSDVGNATIFPHRCTCACDHSWEHMPSAPSVMAGDHVVRCTKCNLVTGYDSSD